MHSIKKFPDLNKEAWIMDNKDLVDEQLAKFEGLFGEPLQSPFQEVMSEYVFLSNTVVEIIEWKENFARFLSYTMNVDEGQIREGSGKKDFHGGRLSLIKELLDWF
jgi:hypothetical protein